MFSYLSTISYVRRLTMVDNISSPVHSIRRNFMFLLLLAAALSLGILLFLGVSTARAECVTIDCVPPPPECGLACEDPEPVGSISATIASVNELEASGVLNSGQASSLRAPLNAALQSFSAGNVIAGNNQLNAFGNQVRALRAAGILSAEEANELLNPLALGT
jgi:hypothetical protein